MADSVEQKTDKGWLYQFRMASNTASVIPYIFNNGEELRFVAIKRGHEPFKDKLALPGGFLNVGEENLETCAVRELQEETGINVSQIRLEQVYSHSDPSRDPRGPVIDTVFAVHITEAELLAAHAGDDASELVLVKLEKGSYHGAPLKWREGSMQNFAFDHAEALRKFFYS